MDYIYREYIMDIAYGKKKVEYNTNPCSNTEIDEKQMFKLTFINKDFLVLWSPP